MTRTSQQRRPLTIALIVSLLFGAYFLRHFLSLLIFAAIVAYLFNPVFRRLSRRFKHRGSAASVTLLLSFLALIIPVALVVIATVFQIKHLLSHLPDLTGQDLGRAGREALDWVNNLITDIPGVQPLTVDKLADTARQVAEAVSRGFLNILTSSISSLSGFFVSAIIYIYVFLNLLQHQDELLETIIRLNPLGRQRSQIYLQRVALMTKSTVRGQFTIAGLQGLAGAIILAIVGLPSVFFFMLMILSVLSIIPLGGGVITIPIGVIMLLTGHVWQGLFVIAAHLLIVDNIDNILRPRLVSRYVALNTALTLLAVFAGVSMFGFIGVVIGPIIMIIITTTIQMYLESPQPT